MMHAHLDLVTHIVALLAFHALYGLALREAVIPKRVIRRL
jgi:hypothetical protein